MTLIGIGRREFMVGVAGLALGVALAACTPAKRGEDQTAGLAGPPGNGRGLEPAREDAALRREGNR